MVQARGMDMRKSGEKSAGKFISRAGKKLDAALGAFNTNVNGRICADFGCNVGGFTNCLLTRGARRVYAVDTGYGELAWKLRKDDRVVVMERTNALHCSVREPVDLVTIDVAWTPQRLIVPAAMRWLRPDGVIISLLKPHYELAKMQRGKVREPIELPRADRICNQVCGELAGLGVSLKAVMRSGLLGKGGNVEYLLLLASIQENP